MCINAEMHNWAKKANRRACGDLYGLSDAELLHKQAIICWKSFSDMTAKDPGDGLLPEERVFCFVF